MKTAGYFLMTVTIPFFLWGLTPVQGGEKADMLIGKWISVGETGKQNAGVWVEFSKEGMMTYSFGPKDTQTYVGKYKVVDDKNIQIEWTGETLQKNNILNKKAKKVQFTISADRLTFDPTLTRLKKMWVRVKSGA